MQVWVKKLGKFEKKELKKLRALVLAIGFG